MKGSLPPQRINKVLTPHPLRRTRSVSPGKTTLAKKRRTVRFHEPANGCKKPRRNPKELLFSTYIGNSVRNQASLNNCPSDSPYLKYDIRNRRYCCVRTSPKLLDVLQYIVEITEPEYYKMDRNQRSVKNGVDFLERNKTWIIRKLNRESKKGALTPIQQKRFQTLLEKSAARERRDHQVTVENSVANKAGRTRHRTRRNLA